MVGVGFGGMLGGGGGGQFARGGKGERSCKDVDSDAIHQYPVDSLHASEEVELAGWTDRGRLALSLLKGAPPPDRLIEAPDNVPFL